MAKVKFGAMMTDMRGKLGGQVFSRNRGGAYVRTKVTPTNPQTADQVEQRARLAQFSQAWRGLTEAQRLAWASVVSQWSTTDVFGDIVNPTGATLHTRLNMNIALAGGTAITTPPSPIGIDTPANISIVADASSSSLSITFDPAAVPAGLAMIVEATPQMSPGIYNANNQFRIISVVEAAEASPYAAGPAYEAKFGDLVTGQKVFVRLKFISLTTGEVSQSLVTYTVVVA